MAWQDWWEGHAEWKESSLATEKGFSGQSCGLGSGQVITLSRPQFPLDGDSLPHWVVLRGSSKGLVSGLCSLDLQPGTITNHSQRE